MTNPAAIGAAVRGDFVNALIASTPGGIQRQEKAGQEALVASDKMPVEMDDRAQFESVGFVFGQPIDELFLRAKLPEGWTRRPTDHSMWSDIIDQRGRVRVNVFYKAAFYDRKAHSELMPRFSISEEYVNDWAVAKTVTDAGEIIHRVPMPPKPEKYDDAYWQASRAARDEATAWLTAARPNWQDPTAYWDEA